MEPLPPSASPILISEQAQAVHTKTTKGGPGTLLIPPHSGRDHDQEASESQLSPGFNAETSTTDSGVSNASSLTSDCATHLNGTLTNPNGAPVEPSSENLEVFVSDVLNSGDNASSGWLKDRRREEDCLGKDGGGGREGCLNANVTDVGDTVSTPPLSDVASSGSSTGVTPSETGSSRCSSSLGYLEPRPPPPPSSSTHHPNPSPHDIQKRLLERIQNMTTSDCSHETESTDSLVLPSERLRRSSVSPVPTQPKTFSLLSIFKKKRLSYVGSADPTSQNLLAATSTTGLILENRPKNLPAKPPAEVRKHQKMYEQMVATARKKGLERAKEEVRKEQQRRQKDKTVGESLREWSRILPNWETLHKTRKVQDLWWQGLPPGVRGEVWKRAIGNDLSISPDLYRICLSRCNERLALAQQKARSDSNTSRKSLSREHSVEVIHLDVLRTFPTLGFFQEGGPYNETLHDVLGAYACYRPDVGYVQGMSFLAAVLLLNMEASDAFICLANLLNRPSYLAFFKVDHTLMQPYFDTFNVLLQDLLPRLSVHFMQLEFSPEYYLIDWIFTIYTKVLPLDIACRVWDLFCRDGDSFLFRTALGILHLYQSNLLEFQALEDMGQFLGKLPETLDSETLFSHISSVSLTSKRFAQTLQQQQQQLPQR